MSTPPVKLLVDNRRARFDYHLDDRFEAGISLTGSEVKSLRAGQGNLQDAFVKLTPKGAWILGFHIALYTEANRNNHEPLRQRQLLLQQKELQKLRKATSERGRTIVPTKVYLKGSWVKIEIAIARGKKQHDKRQALKERTAKEEMRRRRG